MFEPVIYSNEITAPAGASFAVIGNTGSKITVAGNQAARFGKEPFQILGSNLNDGFYAFKSVSVAGGNTELELAVPLSVFDVSGNIIAPSVFIHDLNFIVSGAGYVLSEHGIGVSDAYNLNLRLIIDDGQSVKDLIRVPWVNEKFRADREIKNNVKIQTVNYEVSAVSFALWLRAEQKQNDLSGVLNRVADSLYSFMEAGR
mgnify:CR=1 FL=1